MSTKKVAYKIYEITVNERTFHIDGQNHEFDSREWQVFELINSTCEYSDLPDMEWIETYRTKSDAIKDIESNFTYFK